MSTNEKQEATTINPNSLKIQLAYRFHHALKNLNNGGRRSHRIKIAAYTSMASVAGSRRAWSRAILRKMRNYRRKRNNRRRLHRVGFTTRRMRRNGNRNPKGDGYMEEDPIGDSGQEVKLRKLVPGTESMDAYGLLDETADYIKSLATQVEVMRTLLDLYSTF